MIFSSLLKKFSRKLELKDPTFMQVLAKSKFWYFMKKVCKAKKTGGEMLAINEIYEKNPNAVKNYGIWLRYRSRTDQHNMYKEYRDLTINGAVSQMYAEMSGRHRAHAESITIMKTAIIPASKVRRDHVKQMLNSKLKSVGFLSAQIVIGRADCNEYLSSANVAFHTVFRMIVVGIVSL